MKIWTNGPFPPLSVGRYFWIKCNHCKRRALAYAIYSDTKSHTVCPDTCCCSGSVWITEGSCDIKILCA